VVREGLARLREVAVIGEDHLLESCVEQELRKFRVASEDAWRDPAEGVERDAQPLVACGLQHRLHLCREAGQHILVGEDDVCDAGLSISWRCQGARTGPTR